MTSDLDLLRQFARENSQDAFTEIVRRHVNLVYSAARRQVRSPQLAEEVAQSVFTDRVAVLLHQSENKSLREAGQTLGTSEDAVQKLREPFGCFC
jgi:DNA-directed RNA polymerase specialized sigma24 family protein